jgi:prolyl-tRNA synthetase
MRYSKTLITTLKESPSDAEVVSHQLLIRAGMIRKLAQGIYTYLPLGLRVIKKIENIIREEMNNAGAVELQLPLVLPSELWIESGRWNIYGKELLRFQDRNERWFCLGPTHEEAITDLVRKEVRSYKQLPINLYQIQIKFRDEIRPRFGLMRGREFIMKDGYSFHEDDASAEDTYNKMYDAYNKIFSRCGLKFRAVEADTGAIGGSFSHEFMVLAETGEEVILSCNSCDYAANQEKAERGVKREKIKNNSVKNGLEKVYTPGKRTVEEVSAFLKISPSRIIKTIILKTENDPVALLVRGDREANLVKFKNITGIKNVELADDETIRKVTGAPVGFAGPIGLKIKKFADYEIAGMTGMASGANEKDYHYINIDVENDFKVDMFGDFRNAVQDDPCPKCSSGKLMVSRGIEVGHIFKLGKKYSSAMKATFLDREGKEREFIMGCYGIGVGRLMAAAVEQSHDERGIIWPASIAPYTVVIMPVNWRDDTQRLIAEKLYIDFLHNNIEVILDDRDVSAGIKFMDADLMGYPLRIVIGQKYVKDGLVEVKLRKSGEQKLFKPEELSTEIKRILNEL